MHDALSQNLRHLSSSETVAISTEAKRRQAAGEDVIDLGAGEPDFDTPAAVAWITSHQFQIWLVGFLVIVLLAVIFSLFYVLFNVLMFLFWAAVLWLVSRLRHRKFLFNTGFKIAVHASVLPLVISALTFMSSSGLIFILNLFLFTFYTISWYRSLTP